MKAARPAAGVLRANHRFTIVAAALVAAAIVMSSAPARAESNFVNGAGTANARLNFSIVIPKFLYLQVGTGTYPTTVATIDSITFDMTSAVASIGNGTPQAATAASGDLGNGAVTA